MTTLKIQAINIHAFILPCNHSR